MGLGSCRKGAGIVTATDVLGAVLTAAGGVATCFVATTVLQVRCRHAWRTLASYRERGGRLRSRQRCTRCLARRDQ